MNLRGTFPIPPQAVTGSLPVLLAAALAFCTISAILKSTLTLCLSARADAGVVLTVSASLFVILNAIHAGCIMVYEFRNRWTNAVVFGIEAGTLREALQIAANEARSLSGLNLSDMQLQNINLEKANLSGANLDGADLSGANLARAKLAGATLRFAILHAADFTRANLVCADCHQADCAGADFTGADLTATSGIL